MRSRLSKAGLGAILVAAMTLTGVPSAISGAASTSYPAKFDADIYAPTSSPRAIVGFDHDVTGATVQRLAAAGITSMVRIDTIDAVGVLGPKSVYEELARWDDVAYVDADSPLRWNNYAAKRQTRVTKVRAGRRPLSQRYNGKGVTVAVIDTGIEPHPDLADRVAANFNFEPGWFMDMIHDGKYSDQLVETTGNPVDSYGHGTHVAGIVAGDGRSGSGADFSGVAPRATLVNFKIADVTQGVDCSIPCDFGWELNALVAYEYLIEHRRDKRWPGKIRVATNSWSIYEVDSGAEPITLIVQAAARRGIINTFAAGNDGPDKNTVALGPNRLESVITVGASCKIVDSCGRGKIAEFSSRGPQVDIAAPGANIYSTIARASVLWPIGGHQPPGSPSNALHYAGFSGTSMATPHVAGIVALMLDANPRLTRRQVERILIRTATDRGRRGFDNSWGYGEANAFQAVERAEDLR
jgi:serine protease AprX